MRRELAQLESDYPSLQTPDSPTQRVGAAPAEGFETAPHRSPMLSLDNAMNADEMRAFGARVARLLGFPDAQAPDGQPPAIDFVAEPKLDGSAIELIYENGLLVQGLTRGDGQTGEDVTANLRHVPSIPERLSTEHPPEIASVRGEVVLPLAAFESLNASRTARELKPFENPRNAAAGSLRQIHDIDYERLGSLEFRGYALAEGRPPELERQSETLALLGEWGFVDQPRDRDLPRRRRSHRLPRRPALEARGAARGDRRHRLQGRPPRPAGRARHPRARTALGDRLQVPARAGGDHTPRHRVPGRPNRRAHPGGSTPTRAGRRRHRLERVASQSGRDRAQGHPGRRPDRDPARRGRDSPGRARAHRPPARGPRRRPQARALHSSLRDVPSARRRLSGWKASR